MTPKKLPANFYNRPTSIVARVLLGKVITVTKKGKKISAVICETEAYCGVRDRACHSYGRRRTDRTKIMYASAGRVYMFLVYGLHWQLNIVTREKDCPEAVLIRAVVPIRVDGKIEWEKKGRTNGPGKLTKFLKIDGSLYGHNLMRSKKISLQEWGIRVARKDIKKFPRVGISYAGPVWAKKPWRFIWNK